MSPWKNRRCKKFIGTFLCQEWRTIQGFLWWVGEEGEILERYGKLHHLVQASMYHFEWPILLFIKEGQWIWFATLSLSLSFWICRLKTRFHQNQPLCLLEGNVSPQWHCGLHLQTFFHPWYAAIDFKLRSKCFETSCEVMMSLKWYFNFSLREFDKDMKEQELAKGCEDTCLQLLNHQSQTVKIYHPNIDKFLSWLSLYFLSCPSYL